MQNGRTALIRASFNGHTATVQYLVKETSAQVNVTDNVSHIVVFSRNSHFVPIQLHYKCIKSS